MTKEEALTAFKKQCPIIFNNGRYNLEYSNIKYIMYGIEDGKYIMLLTLNDQSGHSILTAKLSDCSIKND